MIFNFLSLAYHIARSFGGVVLWLWENSILILVMIGQIFIFAKCLRFFFFPYEGLLFGKKSVLLLGSKVVKQVVASTQLVRSQPSPLHPDSPKFQMLEVTYNCYSSLCPSCWRNRHNEANRAMALAPKPERSQKATGLLCIFRCEMLMLRKLCRVFKTKTKTKT